MSLRISVPVLWLSTRMLRSSARTMALVPRRCLDSQMWCRWLWEPAGDDAGGVVAVVAYPVMRAMR